MSKEMEVLYIKKDTIPANSYIVLPTGYVKVDRGLHLVAMHLQDFINLITDAKTLRNMLDLGLLGNESEEDDNREDSDNANEKLETQQKRLDIELTKLRLENEKMELKAAKDYKKKVERFAKSCPSYII